MTHVVHHKEGESGYTLALIILPLIGSTLKQTQSKNTGTNDYTVHLVKVCIGSRAPQCSAVVLKLLWKPSKDAALKSTWNQISLPIYETI